MQLTIIKGKIILFFVPNYLLSIKPIIYKSNYVTFIYKLIPSIIGTLRGHPSNWNVTEKISMAPA